MTFIEQIKNRLRDLIPEFDGRVAGFPYMPSVEQTKERFKTRPYAMVFPTGIAQFDRDPAEPWVPAYQKVVSRGYDIAINFDPLLIGQEATGKLAEELPEKLILAFTNWRPTDSAGCEWICDALEYAPAVNTDQDAIMRLGIVLHARVAFPPVPEDISTALEATGAPFRVHAKGSIQ